MNYLKRQNIRLLSIIIILCTICSNNLLSQNIKHCAKYCETGGFDFDSHTDEFNIDISIDCYNGSYFDNNVSEFIDENIDIIFIGGDNSFSETTASIIEDDIYNSGKILVLNFWSIDNFNNSLPAINDGNLPYGDYLEVVDPTNSIFEGLPLLFSRVGTNYTRRSAIPKDNSTVLLKYDNNDPALLYWKYGNGYVIEWTLELMGAFNFGPGEIDLIIYRLIKQCLEENTLTPCWIGFYNNLPNNPDITDSKELWAGQTNSTPLPPIKICADGSNATLIKFKNNTEINDDFLKFAIESYTTSNAIDYSGEFRLEDYSYNEDTIIARFTHPTYMDIESLYREDKIQIIDISNNDNLIYEYPIQVYRAPVLMVHGLWGSSSTFTNMETDLINSGRYNDPLVYRASYVITNSLSFSENANVIKNAVNGTFYSTRFWNYSAGKIDVVAHSMGGVLSRLYLQNPICSQNQTQNCYREDIHKLITIGTPHSGTQSANLLMSNTVEGILARLFVNGWLQTKFPGKHVNDGAAEDLQVDSYAVENNLNGATLNNNNVPSHVVTTEASFSSASSWMLFFNIVAPILNMSINDYLSYLYYNVSNDLIVPVNSEDGGLVNTATTHFMSQPHLGQASNNDIINEIKIGLNLEPSNNSYFSHSGFTPATLTSHYKSDPFFVLPLELADGSIDIISPNNGDTFNAGDIIQVSVSGSSDISKIIFTAFSSSFNDDVFIKDTTQLSSTIFNYQIPSDSYGLTNIMVFGYDDEGYVSYDTLAININTTANLDSIICDPKRMFLVIGQKQSIFLTGYFNDGIQRNLSYINEVQYSIIDTAVAKYVNLNIFEGKSIGTTILTINYQNQSIEIPIEVFEAENWVGILENPHWDKSNGQSIIKNLNVYPNPSNGIITLEYNLLESAFVKLEVYNLFGNMVSIKIYKKQSKDKHSIQVNLRALTTGIYFYTLTANSSCQSGKLIIMK
ncbi:MAG: T9SS type A sorting domain-containing protein [Candidatus Tenebribacter mawsonii]|nr:T9SS type A sorting domain-containing protein [Candidatus Tenebribacter mawsonii]